MFRKPLLLAASLMLAVAVNLPVQGQAPGVKTPGVKTPGAVPRDDTPAQQPPNIFGLKFRQAGIGRVLVEYVDADGVAAKAGVQVGDQILSLASLPVETVAALEKRLLTIGPEEQVEFSFYRNNRPFNVVLTALTTPVGGTSAPATAAGPSAPVEQSNVLGMTLKETGPTTVMVTRVSPNTPAAAAGVQAGDIVVAVAGHRASPLKDLMPFAVKLVTTEKPGTAIAIDVMRNGKQATLNVPPVGTFNSSSANVQAVAPGGPFSMIIGLILRDVSPNTVSVVNVLPGSPADLAGIKPGDTISAMDRQSVASSQELMGIVGAHRVGDTIDVQVVRAGKPFLTQMALVPRLVDLTVAGAREATGAAGQEVRALEQQIIGLRQQVQMLQTDLQQAQQTQLNAEQSRSGNVSATRPPAPAP